jgi:hypothetical protein
MSDTGFTVPGMTEPPRRYDVTITVDRGGGHPPNPAEFAVAAGQAASARAASIVSAHTASQTISIVTVLAADQSAAVAVALAVVSDALNHPVAYPSADRAAVADLVRRLAEPDVPVVPGAAHTAPQRQVAHPTAAALGFAGWLADAGHP